MSSSVRVYMQIGNYKVFIINFIFAMYFCWGLTGQFPRLHDVLLIWCIFQCIWLQPIIFKLTFLPLFIILLYIPIGLQYGFPSVGIIASLYETNMSEVLEFWDLKSIVYYIITIFFFIFCIQINQKLTPTTKQKKIVRAFALCIVSLFIINIAYKNIYYSKVLSFIPHVVAQTRLYLQDKQQIEEEILKQDSWIIESHQSKYQNYIVVIGESVQKDYMSVYGYPIQTTPFLEQVKGIRYNNFIAPAAYTALSIPRLLSVHQDTDVQYHNSLIPLANKLGMHTYWISNQGVIGQYDSAVTFLSVKAQHKFFLRDKNSNEYFDHELLPIVQNIIKQNPPKNSRLIVLHLMGSHQKFCQRVDENYPHFNFEDENLSCYLSSILQTDQLLKNIYQSLKVSGQSFKLLYTADHGLTLNELKHDASYESLRIPLFLMDSDDTQQNVQSDFISGMDFIWFLTHWLDADVQHQQEKSVEHYQQKTSDQIFIFDEKMIRYNSLNKSTEKINTPETD